MSANALYGNDIAKVYKKYDFTLYFNEITMFYFEKHP